MFNLTKLIINYLRIEYIPTSVKPGGWNARREDNVSAVAYNLRVCAAVHASWNGELPFPCGYCRGHLSILILRWYCERVVLLRKLT
jgi:hypothetical protein